MQMAPVSIEPICRTSLDVVKSGAREKRIKAVLTTASAVETARADSHRLEQMPVHLMEDGVKFAPEGGTMGLEVEGDAEGEMGRAAGSPSRCRVAQGEGMEDDGGKRAIC